MLRVLISVFFCVHLIIYIIGIPDEPNYNFQGYCLIVALFSLFVFFKLREKSNGLFSFSTLFILGFFIVFFQIPLLHFFGYRLSGYFFWFIWSNEKIINLSFYLSSVGLLSFVIAFLTKKKYKSKTRAKEIFVYNNNFVVLLAYLFYILFVVSSGSYITGEYTPADASGISSYAYKLFKVALSASILINIVKISKVQRINSLKNYLRLFNPKLLYLLLFFLVFSLFVGDRGPVMYFSLLSFSFYFIRYKKLSTVRFFLIILLASTFLSIIGAVRQSRYSGESYSERIVNVISSFGGVEDKHNIYESSVPGSSSIEFAKSFRTLNHAIANVPSNYDYFYGLFQIKHLISIVPGISKYYLEFVFDGQKKFDGSSNFVTYLIQGDNPSSGDGSSILADLYLDFGIYGVVLGMFLFGRFIMQSEGYMFVNPVLDFKWIAAMVYFSLAIYINRSAILLEFSNICMIFILIKFNELRYKKF